MGWIAMEGVSQLSLSWSVLGTKELDDWVCERLNELCKSVGERKPKRKRKEDKRETPASLYQVTLSVLVAHGYLKSGDLVYCEIWEPKDGHSSEVVLRRHEGKIGENGSIWLAGEPLSFNTPSQFSNHYYQRAAKAAEGNPNCRLSSSANTRQNGWTFLKHGRTDLPLDHIRNKAWMVFSQKKTAI